MRPFLKRQQRGQGGIERKDWPDDGIYRRGVLLGRDLPQSVLARPCRLALPRAPRAARRPHARPRASTNPRRRSASCARSAGWRPFPNRPCVRPSNSTIPITKSCSASRKRTDPIIPLVEKLLAEQPEGRGRLLIGDDPISPNPKLNNCFKGWQAAKHQWIVLADSNVLAPKDYLQQMLVRLHARCRPGLFAAARRHGRRASRARLECAFLNSYPGALAILPPTRSAWATPRARA